MSAPKYDIQLAQGETFYTALTLDEGGAVMDLTGYAFEGQILATPEDPTVLASFGFDERAVCWCPCGLRAIDG